MDRMDRVMIYTNKDIEIYLESTHSTLWGQSFDVVRHKNEAVAFISDMLEQLEHIHMERVIEPIITRIKDLELVEDDEPESEIQPSVLGKPSNMVQFPEDKGGVFTHSLWAVRKSLGRRKRDWHIPYNK
jgi:hypothetical protein